VATIAVPTTDGLLPPYNRGMKTRIDETNVLYYQNGQDQALEHEYAAALWVLDYLSYMAYKTKPIGYEPT